MLSASKLKVVVVGAGFGGLEVAKGLAREPVQLSVIDQQNHHCFQPLLYQVATAALSPADVAWPVRGILGRQRNTRVLMASVTGIDTESKCVIADTVRLPYDVLILATGATHSYFGHDEWAEFAPGLKRVEDATEIRRRLLTAFERAELTDDEEDRKRLMTFVIIGAGPTGVEMAGAIAEIAREALPLDFRRIDPGEARVVLIEAGPRLLPSFDAKISDYVDRELRRMGVEPMMGTRVTGCGPEGVDLGHANLPAGTVIWAAGVVASPAAEWLGVEADRAGRIRVNPDLTVPGHPDIYAIGDTALVTAADGRSVPGIAPAAKQMGRFVADRIRRRLASRASDEAFIYRHHGDLATVGRKVAVVQTRRIRLKGFLGWLFWSFIHVYYLIGLRNRFVVAANWLWSYVTFQRSARLITQRIPLFPGGKLRSLQPNKR